MHVRVRIDCFRAVCGALSISQVLEGPCACVPAAASARSMQCHNVISTNQSRMTRLTTPAQYITDHRPQIHCSQGAVGGSSVQCPRACRGDGRPPGERAPVAAGGCHQPGRGADGGGSSGYGYDGDGNGDTGNARLKAGKPARGRPPKVGYLKGAVL